MHSNIILAGVGGQGILSIAYVLDNAALAEGYRFKQSEVHGMSQRGGAVSSHLRIAKGDLWSDLVPEGQGDLVLSVEPLESLRYTHYLRPGGWVVSSMSPFVNIPDYPDLEGILDRVAGLPTHVLVDADALARKAGSSRASNMVMVGAAARFLPLPEATLRRFVGEMFRAKGDKAMAINDRAFQYGLTMSGLYQAARAAGLDARTTRALCRAADPDAVDLAAVPAWAARVTRDPATVSTAAAGSLRLTAEGARA